MCQFGVWPECCNNCDFCLRAARVPIGKEKQLQVLDFIKKNIEHIDWRGKFSAGISLLGGELYYITDSDLQASFLDLIDVIIERILKVSSNPFCRYSTVTNGLYDPTFLYQVIDKIRNSVGIDKVDLNFSYDMKYRYKSAEDEALVLKNINAFHDRYQYGAGVQMILTQNVINLWQTGKWDINEFMQTKIPDNNFCFLYPHKIRTGKTLDDFFFKRSDFIEFMQYLRTANFHVYRSFLESTKHSALFKYTGYHERDDPDVTQQPILCDDKEVINQNCGHSVLYQCYSDSDKCMLCDLENMDSDGLLS